MKSLADVLGVPDPVHTDRPVAEYEPKNAREFALRVLQSPEYRASLQRRVILDELPPAVETWLLSTAYGKPVDRMEVRDTTNPLADLSEQSLIGQLRASEERARFLRSIVEAIEPSERVDDEAVTVN